jgi:hypothetical protein
MRFFAIACAAVTALVTTRVAAQQWSARSARLVMPYPAGGDVDGAAGNIANKPHTLFVDANGPLLFVPEIAERDLYGLKRDFVPITSISMTPLVLGFMPGIQVLTALPRVKTWITGISPAVM